MDLAEQASLGIVQSAQERRSLLTVLKIANVGGLVHLVMLLQFALLGPPQLAWFNLGSVATFAVARLLASRGYRLPALLPMQFEVLLQNAARLLGRPSVPTKVVETEAEARAWLAEVRMATGSAR